jgi:general secretion pathway protein A
MHVHTVHINNPTLSRGEFVQMLAGKFGLSDSAAHSKAVMLTELEALLQSRRNAAETSVMIVDEAQSLPLDLLEEIRLLANIETDSEKLLSVIIAGQPELADRLNRQELRQLKQRVALRCELRALRRVETEAYIAGRIRAAGGVGAQVFTREAVVSIHEAAKGLPRTINVIADNALLGGFAAGRKPVGTDLVAEVCRDFDLQTSGVSASIEAPHAMPETQPVISRLRQVSRDTVSDSEAGSEGSSPRDDRTLGIFASRRKRFSFFWN